MAMWKMETWDHRDEDELIWRRVKRGTPWMTKKQREGRGWHAGSWGE